jgi:hypothetical protein
MAVANIQNTLVVWFGYTYCSIRCLVLQPKPSPEIRPESYPPLCFLESVLPTFYGAVWAIFNFIYRTDNPAFLSFETVFLEYSTQHYDNVKGLYLLGYCRTPDLPMQLVLLPQN